MKVPWRFILGLVLGGALGVALFLVFLYTQLGVPTHMSQWISDISQKKERLAAAIPGPKLLIVSGSSALFSINAKLIEQETGFPTINFGTHAGLCLDYRLYRIRQVARPGDKVLLACEYEFYDNGFAAYSEWNDDYILARDPVYFYRMPLGDKIDMATRIAFKRLQKGWSDRFHPEVMRPPGAPPYPVYTPITPGIDCLDDHGDMIFNTLAARPPPKPGGMERLVPILVKGLPSDDTDGFRVLASFIRWAHEHNVEVLATFPAIVRQPVYAEPYGVKALATITEFYTSHHVPVVGNPQEDMLAQDLFYDSMYHLTHESALERTKRLIPELEPYLPPKK